MYKALCLFRDQWAHIKPVEAILKQDVEFVYDAIWNESIIDEVKPDIVIGINEFHWEVAKCYKKAQRLNIPTLTLQDGILEWRFMFQNEMYDGNVNGVPMHQPVLANKYACLGLNLANIIAGLGNTNRIEVTGMPKLDSIGIVPLQPNQINTAKVLVITAAKPWFDDSQKKVVLQMLQDIKSYFENKTAFQITWRITKLLDKELNVNTTFSKKDSLEIAEQIRAHDIVISTTSTAMLEAMRLGKPVAKIDYFNLPDMLQTVWNIRHKEDFDAVLQQMMSITSQQAWYQNFLLNAQCVNDSLASRRVADLVKAMIVFSKNNPIEELPTKMVNIGRENLVFEFPSNFYPQRKNYNRTDIEWLQAENVRLELRSSFLQKQLERRGLRNMLLSGYSKILKKIRK